MRSSGLYRRTFRSSILLFGILVGAASAVLFQLVYVPITTGLGLTVAFFWGFFFLLFELPVGAIAGAAIGLVLSGLNSVLPANSRTKFRGVVIGLASALMMVGVICALELLVPGESGLSLTFYASVTVSLGFSFGLFTWAYFRRSQIDALTSSPSR